MGSSSLTLCSTVLAGMFDLATESTVIEMDFPDSAVRLLLDFAAGIARDTSILSILSLKSILDFSKLVDFYDCSDVVEAASRALNLKASHDPLEYLVLASERDDEGLAKTALKTGRRQVTEPAADKFFRAVSRLQPGWRLPILNAMLKVATGQSIQVVWPEEAHIIGLKFGSPDLPAWQSAVIPPEPTIRYTLNPLVSAPDPNKAKSPLSRKVLGMDEERRCSSPFRARRG